MRLIPSLILLCCPLAVRAADAPVERPRVVVLTDMGADPDDQQSLVRLLLYSNELDIEALVATTSCWQQQGLRPDFIHATLDAYALARPNLLLHDPAFPDADVLRSRVKSGVDRYGMAGQVGGAPSEGAAWLIQCIKREDTRPLWVSVWGGANTLAQTLRILQETCTSAELDRLVGRLRVYSISDQDDAGAWLRRTFPRLFYIVSPGDDYGQSTWIAINNPIEGIDNTSISNSWLARHIQQGHGPLGAAYPDAAWGMEGDTPSFLGVIPNGLNVPDRPDFGGWGGRYELAQPALSSIRDADSIVVPEVETRPIWTNSPDAWSPYLPQDYKRAVKRSDRVFTGDQVTLWRWRDDFQNDFAARMDWTVKPYFQANHPPQPRLRHAPQLTVKGGEAFTLDAFGSTDPDGDSLSFLWFYYPEAGTYRKPLNTNGAENADRYHLTAPKVERPESLHFILKVTDKGTPALSRYQRVIVTVVP